MGDLSLNFSRYEFKCKCGKCAQDTVDVELIKVLERVRSHFNARVTVNSGNRCEDYNRAVGGGEDSQHLKSRAADIVVKGVSPMDVYAYLVRIYPIKYGIGSYGTFTHIDTRALKARW